MGSNSQVASAKAKKTKTKKRDNDKKRKSFPPTNFWALLGDKKVFWEKIFKIFFPNKKNLFPKSDQNLQ